MAVAAAGAAWPQRLLPVNPREMAASPAKPQEPLERLERLLRLVRVLRALQGLTGLNYPETVLP